MKPRSESVHSQSKHDQLSKLNHFYDIAQATILHRQDPITGLLPSLQIPDQAWVRDNVYVATATWAISLGYRKLVDQTEVKARYYELQQSVVKQMRGLLSCMQHQIMKVENFKSSLSPGNALHAKYSSKTTRTVVGDFEYGHLQLDATSLFLLMLAQMISSGLRIIFSQDEVDFIQNLIFYIQSAYMTPDFGMWERGDKNNHGVPELNTSSVGMAKAALEAMEELNLFGTEGGPFSVIHVPPDFIVWCNNVLQAALPRESTSKETDAALLAIITFPAFAVDNSALINTTKQTVISKLEGNYGIKRFLRDGYKCPREDPNRLYYEPSELQLFDKLECEWPFFWAYLIIDGVFRSDTDQVEYASEKLDDVLLQEGKSFPLVPQLYAVPANQIEEEINAPGSVQRIAGGSIPFDWGQSLYLISLLLREDLIAPGELDPLNRRHLIDPKPDTMVQVSIITDSEDLKNRFSALNIEIFTVTDCCPITIYHADFLQIIMAQLGCNQRLKLSGNPAIELGILSTSMLYTLDEFILAFIPELFREQNYYTYSDPDYILDRFKSRLSIVEKNWSHKTGQPTIIFYLSSNQLDINGEISPAFINACRRMCAGFYGGIRINYGKLDSFLATSCMSNLNFIAPESEFSRSAFKRALICSTAKERPPCPVERSSTSIISSGFGNTSSSSNWDQSTPPSFTGSPRISFNLSHAASRGRRAKTLTDIRTAVRQSQMTFGSESPTNLSATPSESPLTESQSMDLGSIESSMSARIMPSSQMRQVHHKTVEDVIALLEATTDIADQAYLLYYLYMARGLGYQFLLHEKTWLLANLISGLYDKAIRLRYWWLVRYCAGMLDYQAKSLSYALTVILIHNKHISVGYPEAPFKEIIFSKPMTLERIMVEIKEACVNDVSMMVLTQEMILMISDIIGTDPNVFKEICLIRVGFLVQVLIQEIKRVNKVSLDDAHSRLYSLSPFELKNIMLSMLTGYELDQRTIASVNPRLKGTITGKLDLRPGKWLGSRRKSVAALDIPDSTDDEEAAAEKYGQWVRRRRIDGSLNRVPVEFYQRIWEAMAKCNGFTIADIPLPNCLIREMTREEFKFAMVIEKAINTIPIPHYRQLIVEATLMACLILQSNAKFFYNGTIDMDQVVYRASDLYRTDALSCGIKVDQMTLSLKPHVYTRANEIASNFFDCAPSGRFGTMNYMLRALFEIFGLQPDFEWTFDGTKL